MFCKLATVGGWLNDDDKLTRLPHSWFETPTGNLIKAVLIKESLVGPVKLAVEIIGPKLQSWRNGNKFWIL